MKIIELHGENFKRIKAITIRPKGPVVEISGENEQGKTSTLDAIEALFGGGKHLPDEPIRRGEKRARLVAKTEGMIVTRRFTPKGSTLHVEGLGPDQTAQAALDELVGSLTFDPLAFASQKPKDQAETLRKLPGVGLDFTALDAEHDKAFKARTDVNRDVKRLTARVEALPLHNDAPAAEISVTELADKMRRGENTNKGHADERAAVDRLRAENTRMINEVASMELKAKTLAHDIAVLREARAQTIKDGKAMAVKVVELQDIDIGAIQKQIGEAEGINAKVRSNKARAEISIELEAATAERDSLTDRLTDIKAQKTKAIAEAKYPLPGLSVDEDCVRLDGVPLSQASEARRIRLSCAIGFASNPGFKVLLVRQGALLTPKSRELLEAEVAAVDGQLWIEVAGNGRPGAVVIEDGQVVGQENYEPGAQEGEIDADGPDPCEGCGEACEGCEHHADDWDDD